MNKNIVTYIVGGVSMHSNLPIEEVGNIISTEIFCGLKFDGLEDCIYEEVPAIYINGGLLGFNFILQKNDINNYYLEIMQLHNVKECDGINSDLHYYLTSLFKERLKNNKDIMVEEI